MGKKFKVLSLVSSLFLIFFTYIAIKKNMFPMNSFDGRIVSLSSIKGIDIDKTIKIYMIGMLLSVAMLVYGAHDIFNRGIDSVKKKITNTKYNDLDEEEKKLLKELFFLNPVFVYFSIVDSIDLKILFEISGIKATLSLCIVPFILTALLLFCKDKCINFYQILCLFSLSVFLSYGGLNIIIYIFSIILYLYLARKTKINCYGMASNIFAVAVLTRINNDSITVCCIIVFYLALNLFYNSRFFLPKNKYDLLSIIYILYFIAFLSFLYSYINIKSIVFVFFVYYYMIEKKDGLFSSDTIFQISGAVSLLISLFMILPYFMEIQIPGLFIFILIIAMYCLFLKAEIKCNIWVYSAPLIMFVLGEVLYNSGLSDMMVVLAKIVIFSLAVLNMFFVKKGCEKKGICYSLLIVGLILYGSHTGYYIPKYLDYFEDANFSVSITSFFDYNKIPVLETFDAHMLSDQIGGYLYRFLGGSSFESAFSPYNAVVTGIIIYLGAFGFFYTLVKSDLSLVLALFVSDVFLYCQLPFSFFVLLVSISLYKNDKIFFYYIYWFVLALSVLYRLDTGLSAGVSSVFCTVAVFAVKKDKKRLFKFLLTFVSVFIAVIGAAFLLLKSSGTDLFNFVIHFIDISAKSNQNWAYGAFGDNISVVIIYFIYTVLLGFIFGLMVTKLLSVLKKDIDALMYISVFYSGMIWILNIPRTMVRHNLMECSELYIIGPAFSFIIIFLFQLFNRIGDKRKRIELISFIIIAFSGFSNDLADNLSGTICTSMKKDNLDSATRVVYDDSLSSELNKIFGVIMDDDETYYDFSNRGLIYSLTGYENPVYENQSPGLLSGESTQLDTIELLRKREIPYIMMPPSSEQLNSISTILDIIRNDYRYYLVSEYIYAEYRPFIKYDSVEMWIKNDLYRERADRLLIDDIPEKAEILYELKPDDLYEKKYTLGYIPYLWANYGDVSECEIQYEVNKDNNSFYVSGNVRDIINGNYLVLTISSDTDRNIDMNLKTEEKTDVYNFDLIKGKNQYIIRISTNYRWFLMNDAFFEFDEADGITINSFSVRAADTLSYQTGKNN